MPKEINKEETTHGAMLKNAGESNQLWCIPCGATMGALCCGLSAVRCASDGNFKFSVVCLFLSCMLDGLDGHLARFLRATTDLGAELDSLCDLADFGVAPAFIIYFWTVQTLSPSDSMITDDVVWGACVIFTSACVCRLARFNLKDREKPMEDKSPVQNPIPVNQYCKKRMYFEGVPAPVGAAYALVPMMLSLIEPGSVFFSVRYTREALVAQLLATAVLMVCKLPTFSSKMLKRDKTDTILKSESSFSQTVKAALALLFLGVMCSYPIELFLFGTLLHACSLPIGWFVYNNFAQ